MFVTHDIDEAIKLGDRIAILNVGGILEQYAPPEEILGDPASEFVADFVGADRGLKRLKVMPITDRGGTGPGGGAVGDGGGGPPGDPGRRGRLGERRRPRTASSSAGSTSPTWGPPRPWPRQTPPVQRLGVTAADSLRTALDSIVTSVYVNVAVVVTPEGQRYLGDPHPRAHLEGAGLMNVLAAEPLIRWDWVGDHLAEIGSRLIEHLELTIIAVVIGFAISFPLAVLAHRRRWTYAPVTWTAGILYTIPSLSLFVKPHPDHGALRDDGRHRVP